MNIKDKLLNAKKKLLVYTAFTTIGAVSLTGCNKFTYNVTDEGIIEVEGEISYDILSSECCFLVFKYTDDTVNYYIANDISHQKNTAKYQDLITGEVIAVLKEGYQELATGKEIFMTNNPIVVDYEVHSVRDFIAKENNVKAHYTVAEVEELLNKFKEYHSKYNKLLIKE